ncbi:MAG: beta-lactamase family protein [Fuerstiella sp.]|nr:beta-lactamase family protein [Fuerstiella sp.]
MKRRTALQTGLTLALGTRALATPHKTGLEMAEQVLTRSVRSGEVEAAALFVRHRETVFVRSFGAAQTRDAIFLLASISKPITVAAVMTLFEENEFRLNDPVGKFIQEFSGDGRDRITMRQLFTHNSGLPDQLPQNQRLRAGHAELAEFVESAIRTPLLFPPGSQYSYSSMGILLASEVAQRISGEPIDSLINQRVFQPLKMKHSALGVGKLDPELLMRCQVENAAPESGSGDANAKDWDWNSDYWRSLGVPWGGAHGSAEDVGRFLDAFLHPQHKLLQPETARMMVTNHNPPGVRPRGLGFDLGSGSGGPSQSGKVFGHTGSTGTLCWADPESDSLCVVLTTLPARPGQPHPRHQASHRVADAVSGSCRNPPGR